jgi:hypothetical protein
MPIVFNHRLYLFWPIFDEKTMDGTGPNEESRSCYEIRIAWSEYRQGQWTPRKIIKDVVNTWPIDASDLTPPRIERHIFSARLLP